MKEIWFCDRIWKHWGRTSSCYAPRTITYSKLSSLVYNTSWYDPNTSKSDHRTRFPSFRMVPMLCGDWFLTMLTWIFGFWTPKTKSSRKTLNFGPKIIEIGPGSSENELCKDHDIPCNFLAIFSKSWWHGSSVLVRDFWDRSPNFKWTVLRAP